MNFSYRMFCIAAIALSVTAVSIQQVHGQSGTTLYINEIMASNTKTLTDEDGDYPDWIELYNAGENAISLEGYTLTDDPDFITKWVFPAVSIQAGSHQTVMLSDKDRSQLSSTWETIVKLNDTWQYLIDTSTAPSNWREVSFDDSGWSTGASGISSLPYAAMGGTVISVISPSFYMRTTFTIDDLSNIFGVTLSMDYQSGFVAYINGHEVARGNIGTSGTPPDYDDYANGSNSPVYYQNMTPPTFQIEDYTDILIEGENVLAVEVHRSFFTGHLHSLPQLSLALNVLPDEPNGAPAQLGLEDLELILHTNFKLNASGETLILADPDSVIVDSLTIANQEADISIGRSPDGSSTWNLFTTPSPGESNGEGYLGFSEATITTSLSNGFYQSAQSITLSTSATGAAIRYTTDGSLPDDNSTEYLAPVVIDTTTVIRAAVFETGYLPGPVLTKTFIIDEDSTIPVFSLTINPSDLWDDETGIYVEGTNGILGGYPDAPVTPVANWNQNWEKPVYVEFFDQGGTLGFETDAGVRIHGKQNRRQPQKSLAIYIRDEYGMDKLEYPLFPGNPITTFKSFILRNSGHDWEASHIRDMFMQSLFEPLDLEMQDGRPTHVYINGVYWGILNLRDKLNENYLATHKNADPDAVDILDDYHARFTQAGVFQSHQGGANETNWTCYVNEGTADHYNALLEYMVNHDESEPDVYEYIKTQVDVENFVDYMVSRVFVADPDGPGHNTKFWRPQTTDGRWRWLMFDTDYGAGLQDSPFGVPGPSWEADLLRYYLRLVQGSKDDISYVSSRSPDANFLLYSLIENQEFKEYFANRYLDLLNTIFSHDVVTAKLAALKAVVEPEIERHIDRWIGYNSNWDFGNPGPLTTKAEWLDNVAYLESFADLRTGFARLNLQTNLGLSEEADLTVNNALTAGGSIRLNTLDLTDASFTGTYFIGLPVHLTATPRPGYRFTGWQGASSSTETSITLNLNGDATVTATFVEDATATNTVVINEICYNASEEYPSGDWVELYSTFTTPLDMSGWKLMDSDETHAFTIPSGTVIEAGGYLVLCRYPSEFSSVFPDVENVIGSLGFGLSSEGELIRLYDSQDTLIDSLTFGVVAPWPVDANGNGPTLELSNPSLDNALASNWELSEGHGTPGVANDTPVSVTEATSSLPASFNLGRNYPNPFNPATTIPFELPDDSMVTIEIFNTLGQRIAVPFEGRLEAGYHSIRFDASSFPSGILIYRMTAGSFTANGRMLLLK